MTTRPAPGTRAPLVTAAVLLVGLGVALWLGTPWHPLAGAVPGGAVTPDAARDFTAAELARSAAFHGEIRPYGLLVLALQVAVPAVLGLTPLGPRLLDRLPGHSGLRVVVAVVGVELATLLATLAVQAHELVVERRFGLTHQGWGGWASDLATNLAIATVTTLVAVAVLTALARRLPRRWWVAAAGLAAVLVVAGSFAYPLVVTPLTTSTRSLPAGALRSSLLGLARQDGQPLRDILVAAESSRTTSENAYVSGFGASRRLVLYDTLLRDDTPAEIRVLTAHELGHTRHHDVLRGTLEAAIGVAAVMCVAGALLGPGRSLPRRLGSRGVGDARAVPLLLAAYTVLALAVTPLTNLVSRQVEARADVHALDLTRDPTDFVAAQRGLAVSSLADLTPTTTLYVLFFDHPTAAQRIAVAQDWARQHGR